MEQVANGRRILTTVIAVARQKRITLTAAGLAFYAFNSFIPLVLLLVIGMSLFETLDTAALAFEYLSGLDADRIESTVNDMIGEGTGRGRAAVIAAGILCWSTATMFQAVNMSFGEVYGTRKGRSLVRKVADTLLIFAIVLLAVVLMGVVGVTLALVVDGIAWRLLSIPLLLVTLFVAFVPIYYRFPGRTTTLRDAVPGAAFAAAAWTALTVGFRLYATTTESVELYGVAGAVLLLLTWLYLGGLTLLLAAILNATLAGEVDADDAWIPGVG